MAEQDAVRDWPASADQVVAGRWRFRLSQASALRDSMLLVVLAAVWIFLSFATHGTFLTQRNLVLLALQTSIVSLAAISAVMLIVTRNFDLSVGSSVALIGVIVAGLTVRLDVNAVVALALCIAPAGAVRAWPGLGVAPKGASSSIAPLA